MSNWLAGRCVVITRPVGEAGTLTELIREAGGEPLICPAIEILDVSESGARALDAVIDRLDDFALAVFISPSAVEKAMTRIQTRRTLPAHLRCAAIGPGGVRALQRFGVREVIAPGPRQDRHERYDSEALLALSALQNVQGQRVVIFRGEGGRELLGETLAARGATVELVACYRRGKPAFDPAPLLRAWESRRVAAVIVTSGEGLRNFAGRLGEAGRPWLLKTPVIVPHPRIAVVARELGIATVVESQTGDEALMQALEHQISTRDGT